MDYAPSIQKTEVACSRSVTIPTSVDCSADFILLPRPIGDRRFYRFGYRSVRPRCPGRQSHATDAERGAVWSTLTNEEGVYSLPRVRTGTYDLKVEREGFQNGKSRR